MKQTLYISTLALAMALAACDSYDLPNPPGQYNPQEPVLEANGIVLEAAPALEQTLNLQAANEAGTPIELNTISLTDFPSTSELKLEMQLSSSDAFAKTTPVEVAVADGVVTVDPAVLQDAYSAGISKGPKEKTVYFRYAAYAVNGDENVRIGGPDFYYGPFEATILPVPSEFVICENYYLIGSINGWNCSTAVPFNHSDENVYDDPVFTIKVDITPDEAANGWWWKIVTPQVVESGDWGNAANSSYGVFTNGDDSAEGMLMPRPADGDCQAGCFKQAGPWLITINMEELTYKFTMAIDNLWTPGDANGWNQAASQMLFTSDYTNYVGFANVSPGGFKFTSAPDWNHLNFGNAGEEGVLTTDSSAGNLSVPTAGLYWLTANIATMTWSAYEITTIGIVGDATPGGWSASTPLTPSEDHLIWTGTVELKGGKEYKFRCNDDWKVSLGGDLVNLDWNNAPNIKCDADGTYDITLYLDLLPYSADVVKK